MFRRIENLEGGPGDPRDVDEWWANFKKLAKNVLLPLFIFVVIIWVLGLLV